MSIRLRLCSSAILACVVAGVFAAGCGSPSGPSTPDVTFRVGFQGTGTFTASLGNLTFNTTGFHSVSLPPGQYEISGTYSMPNSLFAIYFTASGDGVQAGSLRPQPEAVVHLNCSVAFDLAPSQNFLVRFTLTSDPNTSCQTLGQ